MGVELCRGDTEIVRKLYFSLLLVICTNVCSSCRRRDFGGVPYGLSYDFS